MSSKKTAQYTPQSSLGELGQSLLKFITPVRKVKAHTKVSDYLENASHGDRTLGTNPAKATAAPNQAAEKTAAKTAAPAASTGVIKVSRDGSGTPWINVVMNLMNACDQGSAQARGYQASNAYQSAQENKAELRRKTVGRIVNIVTEDSKDEAEAVPGDESEQEASASEGKPEKRVDHFKAASQQNVLKKPA